MEQMFENLDNISNKIKQYNININKIKEIVGEEYKEFIKYFMIYGVYNEPVKKSIHDKIVITLGTYYNGWFENFDLIASFKYNNEKKIFTFNDMKRILLNDYSTEYGRCYKTGELNEEMLLDLIIKIIGIKLVTMNKFSSDIYDSIYNINCNNSIGKLLNNQSENDRLVTIIKLSKDNMEDINSFQNILYKLIALKNNFEYSDIENKINNLSDKDKAKLDILISIIKTYTLSEEEIEFMNGVFHEDLASDILNSMEIYEIVDIYNKTNTNNTKKLVK